MTETDIGAPSEEYTDPTPEPDAPETVDVGTELKTDDKNAKSGAKILAEMKNSRAREEVLKKKRESDLQAIGVSFDDDAHHAHLMKDLEITTADLNDAMKEVPEVETEVATNKSAEIVALTGMSLREGVPFVKPIPLEAGSGLLSFEGLLRLGVRLHATSFGTSPIDEFVFNDVPIPLAQVPEHPYGAELQINITTEVRGDETTRFEPWVFSPFNESANKMTLTDYVFAQNGQLPVSLRGQPPFWWETRGAAGAGGGTVIHEAGVLGPSMDHKQITGVLRSWLLPEAQLGENHMPFFLNCAHHIYDAAQLMAVKSQAPDGVLKAKWGRGATPYSSMRQPVSTIELILGKDLNYVPIAGYQLSDTQCALMAVMAMPVKKVLRTVEVEGVTYKSAASRFTIRYSKARMPRSGARTASGKPNYRVIVAPNQWVYTRGGDREITEVLNPEVCNPDSLRHAFIAYADQLRLRPQAEEALEVFGRMAGHYQGRPVYEDELLEISGGEPRHVSDHLLAMLKSEQAMHAKYSPPRYSSFCTELAVAPALFNMLESSLLASAMIGRGATSKYRPPGAMLDYGNQREDLALRSLDGNQSQQREKWLGLLNKFMPALVSKTVSHWNPVSEFLQKKSFTGKCGQYTKQIGPLAMGCTQWDTTVGSIIKTQGMFPTLSQFRGGADGIDLGILATLNMFGFIGQFDRGSKTEMRYLRDIELLRATDNQWKSETMRLCAGREFKIKVDNSQNITGTRKVANASARGMSFAGLWRMYREEPPWSHDESGADFETAPPPSMQVQSTSKIGGESRFIKDGVLPKTGPVVDRRDLSSDEYSDDEGSADFDDMPPLEPVPESEEVTYSDKAKMPPSGPAAGGNPPRRKESSVNRETQRSVKGGKKPFGPDYSNVKLKMMSKDKFEAAVEAGTMLANAQLFNSPGAEATTPIASVLVNGVKSLNAAISAFNAAREVVDEWDEAGDTASKVLESALVVTDQKVTVSFVLAGVPLAVYELLSAYDEGGALGELPTLAKLALAAKRVFPRAWGVTLVAKTADWFGEGESLDVSWDVKDLAVANVPTYMMQFVTFEIKGGAWRARAPLSAKLAPQMARAGDVDGKLSSEELWERPKNVSSRKTYGQLQNAVTGMPASVLSYAEALNYMDGVTSDLVSQVDVHMGPTPFAKDKSGDKPRYTLVILPPLKRVRALGELNVEFGKYINAVFERYERLDTDIGAADEDAIYGLQTAAANDVLKLFHEYYFGRRATVLFMIGSMTLALAKKTGINGYDRVYFNDVRVPSSIMKTEDDSPEWTKYVVKPNLSKEGTVTSLLDIMNRWKRNARREHVKDDEAGEPSAKYMEAVRVIRATPAGGSGDTPRSADDARAARADSALANKPGRGGGR